MILIKAMDELDVIVVEDPSKEKIKMYEHRWSEESAEGTKFRFSNKGEARELVTDKFGSVEKFMEIAIFSTLENQIADLHWLHGWFGSNETKMKFEDFVLLCSDLWILFDCNIIYLADGEISGMNKQWAWLQSILKD